MSYLYDLHVHTKESSHCGEVPAKDVVERYKNLGYDGIVLTDHFNEDTLRRYYEKDYDSAVTRWALGYREAKKYETENLRVIQGMELRVRENDNDYLVYGFDEDFLRERNWTEIEEIEEFVEAVKGRGLAIFQAHPFRNHISVVKPGLLDGIEIYNGHKNHDSRNDIAYLWAKKFNLRAISGSDFHGNTKGTPGGVRFNENPKDSFDIARLLLSDDYIPATQER